MEGISLVETKTLKDLVGSVAILAEMVNSTMSELKGAYKPYLTTEDVMEITGFGKSWVTANKQDIGFTTVGGCLRFKKEDVDEYMCRNYFKIKK
ncbi:Helix-turn-helix domain-containing protein [Pedobacter westerhofensis]|uniref:Helix-turn-helix domain-containing protein n=1 Tax=Pedobacter westerhofensis TaxID=425512 RepID=A0A521DPV5_9SPHI|nr:helix-turn-helix domain-containing protein [Pedobacter westerhofensis]SMO72950.1 Helix-turn-helix domain-containing protein [Pedobacter westerhofensis]